MTAKLDMLEDWNNALYSWFFDPAKVRNKPVFFAVDDTIIELLGYRFLKLEQTTGVKRFAETIQNYMAGTDNLDLWYKTVPEIRDFDPSQEQDEKVPPFLALLAADALASSRRHSSNLTKHSASHYAQLRNLFGDTNPSKGQIDKYENTVPILWKKLNLWLEHHRGEHGLITAKCGKGSEKNVGWARSQAILLTKDRASLGNFFTWLGVPLLSERENKPLEGYSESYLIEAAREWTKTEDIKGQLKKHLAENSSTTETLGETLRILAQEWNGFNENEEGLQEVPSRLGFVQEQNSKDSPYWQAQLYIKVPEHLKGGLLQGNIGNHHIETVLTEETVQRVEYEIKAGDLINLEVKRRGTVEGQVAAPKLPHKIEYIELDGTLEPWVDTGIDTYEVSETKKTEEDFKTEGNWWLREREGTEPEDRGYPTIQGVQLRTQGEKKSKIYLSGCALTLLAPVRYEKVEVSLEGQYVEKLVIQKGRAKTSNLTKGTYNIYFKTKEGNTRKLKCTIADTSLPPLEKKPLQSTLECRFWIRTKDSLTLLARAGNGWEEHTLKKAGIKTEKGRLEAEFIDLNATLESLETTPKEGYVERRRSDGKLAEVVRFGKCEVRPANKTDWPEEIKDIEDILSNYTPERREP